MIKWRVVTVACFGLALLGTGCAHNIAFDPIDTSWHYTIDATRQEGTALMAVIDERTAKASYDFRAWSTGIAHQWIARYGEMLTQVADVELPQLVDSYQRSSSYDEPTTGQQRLTLVLTIPSYVFEGYRAKLTLHAEAFSPGRQSIFSKSYMSEGGSGAGKMIGLGAFGQKSAVRVSSLQAFRSVFEQMRPDIMAAFQGRGIAFPLTREKSLYAVNEY